MEEDVSGEPIQILVHGPGVRTVVQAGDADGKTRGLFHRLHDRDRLPGIIRTRVFHRRTKDQRDRYTKGARRFDRADTRVADQQVYQAGADIVCNCDTPCAVCHEFVAREFCLQGAAALVGVCWGRVVDTCAYVYYCGN